MSRYLVVSPELFDTIPILEYGQGPLEYYHEVVCVEASSKAKAKVAAVKDPKFKKYVQGARHNGENPFVGLTVEKMELCPHGKCPCGLHDRCEECEAACEAGDAHV